MRRRCSYCRCRTSCDDDVPAAGICCYRWLQSACLRRSDDSCRLVRVAQHSDLVSETVASSAIRTVEPRSISPDDPDGHGSAGAADIHEDEVALAHSGRCCRHNHQAVDVLAFRAPSPPGPPLMERRMIAIVEVPASSSVWTTAGRTPRCSRRLDPRQHKKIGTLRLVNLEMRISRASVPAAANRRRGRGRRHERQQAEIRRPGHGTLRRQVRTA